MASKKGRCHTVPIVVKPAITAIGMTFIRYINRPLQGRARIGILCSILFYALPIHPSTNDLNLAGQAAIKALPTFLRSHAALESGQQNVSQFTINAVGKEKP